MAIHQIVRWLKSIWDIKISGGLGFSINAKSSVLILPLGSRIWSFSGIEYPSKGVACEKAKIQRSRKDVDGLSHYEISRINKAS